MSSRATSVLIRRTDLAGSGTGVSAGKELTNAHADAIGRAAGFRLEAETLRERARATDEAVVREHYLALADRWTIVTLDGSLSAHFEHTVAITENGPRVLTRS